MTTQTPAAVEIEKWLWIRVRFFPNFLHRCRIRVRKKHAESCRSRHRHSRSCPTSLWLWHNRGHQTTPF